MFKRKLNISPGVLPTTERGEKDRDYVYYIAVWSESSIKTHVNLP